MGETKSVNGRVGSAAVVAAGAVLVTAAARCALIATAAGPGMWEGSSRRSEWSNSKFE